MSSHTFCKCSSKASKTFYLEWENYCNLDISFTSTICFLFHWDIEHMIGPWLIFFSSLIEYCCWMLISTKYSKISRKKMSKCLNVWMSPQSTCIIMQAIIEALANGALVMDIHIAMNHWCLIYITHHLVAYREEMKTWNLIASYWISLAWV